MKYISIPHYFLAVIILAVPVRAISQEFNYDFIEATYSSLTVETGTIDIDGNGFSVSGSFSISPNVAFTASFGTESYDRFLGVDVDANSTILGITGHTSTGSKTDIVGGFSVLMGEVEESDGFTTLSYDDTGNIIEFGFRHMVTDTVELTAIFSRTDIFDDTSNQTGFGLRFYSDEKLSLGVGYATGDDVDALLFIVRIAMNQ